MVATSVQTSGALCEPIEGARTQQSIFNVAPASSGSHLDSTHVHTLHDCLQAHYWRAHARNGSARLLTVACSACFSGLARCNACPLVICDIHMSRRLTTGLVRRWQACVVPVHTELNPCRYYSNSHAIGTDRCLHVLCNSVAPSLRSTATALPRVSLRTSVRPGRCCWYALRCDLCVISNHDVVMCAYLFAGASAARMGLLDVFKGPQITVSKIQVGSGLGFGLWDVAFVICTHRWSDASGNPKPEIRKPDASGSLPRVAPLLLYLRALTLYSSIYPARTRSNTQPEPQTPNR
jgi:hypothetical protein